MDNQSKRLDLPPVGDIPHRCYAIEPTFQFGIVDISWWSISISALTLDQYLKRPKELIAAFREALDEHAHLIADPDYKVWGVHSTPVTRLQVNQGLSLPMTRAPWDHIDRTNKYLTLIREDLRDECKWIGCTHYIKLSEHERIVGETATQGLKGIEKLVKDHQQATRAQWYQGPVVELPDLDKAALERRKAEQEASKRELERQNKELQTERRILGAQIDKLKAEVDELQRAQRQIAAAYPDLTERLDVFRRIIEQHGPVDEAPSLDFEPDGYVYLMSIPSGSYKIGRSTNTKNRIKAFHTDYPEEAKLEHKIPCRDHVVTEKYLKDMFAEKRIRRTEWFRLSVSDVLFIKSIKET